MRGRRDRPRVHTRAEHLGNLTLLATLLTPVLADADPPSCWRVCMPDERRAANGCCEAIRPEADAPCPPGQSRTVDTAGHCCWNAQAWTGSASRCVGVPQCSAPFTARGEECVCADGRVRDASGHCCWPGQTFSIARDECSGRATCPPGFAASGDDCVALAACARGQSITAETNGHCCWPGQVWAASRNQCVGVPTSCPDGFVLRNEGCAAIRVTPSDALSDALVGSTASATQAFNGVTTVTTVRIASVTLDRCVAAIELDVTQNVTPSPPWESSDARRVQSVRLPQVIRVQASPNTIPEMRCSGSTLRVTTSGNGISIRDVERSVRDGHGARRPGRLQPSLDLAEWVFGCVEPARADRIATALRTVAASCGATITR